MEFVKRNLGLLEFKQCDPKKADELATWLSSDTWDFYLNPTIEREKALRWIREGGFHSEDRRTFWIHSEPFGKVGLIQLYDLSDPTSMFDLRIRTQYRGKGIGRHAVTWLTDYLFTNFAHLSRIEGHTRPDNVAMRRVFRACGYVMESHYRAGWQAGDTPDDWIDSIGYAILRYDWANHCTTPVAWDDEPH